MDDSCCLMTNTIHGFTDLPNFYACTLLLKRIASFVKQCGLGTASFSFSWKDYMDFDRFALCQPGL